MARKKTRKRHVKRRRSSPRKRRSTGSIIQMFAPRKRRSKRHMSNPKRHHKGRRRHNPPMGKGLVGLIMGGFTDGFEILVGRYGSKTIPHAVGLNTGMMGALTELVSAIGLGWAADRFLSKNAGKMILAGGFSAVAEDLIVMFNIPVLSQLTMPVPVAAGAIPPPVGAPAIAPPTPVSAYPMLGAYPRTLGDEVVSEEGYSMQQ